VQRVVSWVAEMAVKSVESLAEWLAVEMVGRMAV
jgi:hypothetical protein